METEIMWFELNENQNDLSNVLDFLQRLPSNIEFIFNQEGFIKILNSYDPDQKLFFSALNEASEVLRKEVNQCIQMLNSEDRDQKEGFIYYANTKLPQIGFTGQSLVLKANVLNMLWKKVIDEITDAIIDFANNKIVRAIRRFLQFLNSLLGSLVSFIPGVDAIKEIKEVGESYLGMADE